MGWLLLFYVSVTIATYCVAVYKGWFTACSLPEGRTLFVIAHPDDECMFFAPTILAKTNAEPSSVHLLCVTCGNYRNEGEIRTRELWTSCARLGIPSENILLLNNDFFPDDPKSNWDSSRLAKILLTHIESLDIKVVVSFDEDGVSGHSNHMTIYRALLRLASRDQLPCDCRVFSLDSVMCARKYSAILDTLPTLLLDRRVHLATPSIYSQGVGAMKAHHSQLVWFRRLYVIASRYMLINTYTEVMEDLNLETE